MRALARRLRVDMNGRPDRLVMRSRANFTGASMATKTVNSLLIPSSEYSKTLYPQPCRLTYGIGPRAGDGVGDQNLPLSSSRR